MNSGKPKIRSGLLYFLALGAVFGSIGSYLLIGRIKNSNINLPIEVRADSSKYTYINPLLFYKNERDSELNDLRSKLSSYINSKKETGEAEEVSVYYRDMNSGRWTGVNEEVSYTPASMLKVLYMISYLKRVQSDPQILQKKLYYDATQRDKATFYNSGNDIQSGYYSVNDLINYMIIDSDNAALMALASNDDNQTDSVFQLLQLPRQAIASTSPDFMSARAYSRIFRVLYDSSFLSWSLSDQALKLLSLTKYSDGIQKGVPEEIMVSHKFGERTNINQYGKVVNRELHDCGIIYKGNSPYFLCVMTRGEDFLKLQNIIQEISTLVYQYK